MNSYVYTTNIKYYIYMFQFSFITNYENTNKAKSITAYQSKVTKPSLRHRLLRHTTTNYNRSFVAPYYYVIIMKPKSISNKYYDCIFA